jgi:hypothetical protein
MDRDIRVKEEIVYLESIRKHLKQKYNDKTSAEK